MIKSRKDQFVFVLWLILWIIVPFVGIFTLGIFFFINVALGFLAIPISPAILDNGGKEVFLNSLGMLFLFFVPSIIVLTIGFLLKKYKPSMFKLFAQITLTIALLIILILLFMLIRGDFSIHDA
jgi:hypothetical protein